MEAALARQGTDLSSQLMVMKDAMGIMQHHDAATGTEKQHVANDYARMLHIGVTECQSIQSSYYQ